VFAQTLRHVKIEATEKDSPLKKARYRPETKGNRKDAETIESQTPSAYPVYKAAVLPLNKAHAPENATFLLTG
jgi:hypothetical protein